MLEHVSLVTRLSRLSKLEWFVSGAKSWSILTPSVSDSTVKS
jgi:hypothetical protein